MRFWVLNILIFVIYSVILGNQTKRDNRYLAIALVHLTFLICFRGESIGTDTRSYSNAFELLFRTGNLERHVMATAPLFYQYMKCAARIFPYRNGYILFTAFPTMLCLAYFLYKHAVDYFSSIFLYCACYFYFLSMNAARQFLAVGCLMICYCLVKGGKKKWAWGLFLCACSIHSSAVIFGVFLVLNFIKWNIKKLIAILTVILLSMPLLSTIMIFFVKIYPQYNYVLSRFFDEKYTSQGRSALVYGVYCIIAVIVELLGILYEERKMSVLVGGKILVGRPVHVSEVYDSQQNSSGLIVLVFISGCIFLFYPTSILFWRMAYTGFLFIILLLPQALSRIKIGNLVCKVLMYVPLAALMLLQIAGDYSNVRDYVFYTFR